MVNILKLRLDGDGAIDLLFNGVRKETVRAASGTTIEVPNLTTVTLRAVPDAGKKVSSWYNVYTSYWFPTGLTNVTFFMGTGQTYSYLVFFVTSTDFVPVIKPPTIPDTKPPTIPDTKLPVITPPVSPILPNSTQIGQCSLNPEIMTGGGVWWNVVSPLGLRPILRSGLTYEKAVDYAKTNYPCTMTNTELGNYILSKSYLPEGVDAVNFLKQTDAERAELNRRLALAKAAELAALAAGKSPEEAMRLARLASLGGDPVKPPTDYTMLILIIGLAAMIVVYLLKRKQ